MVSRNYLPGRRFSLATTPVFSTPLFPGATASTEPCACSAEGSGVRSRSLGRARPVSQKLRQDIAHQKTQRCSQPSAHASRPLGKGLDTCAAGKMRALTIKNRFDAVDAMGEEELDGIIAHHKACMEEREQKELSSQG